MLSETTSSQTAPHNFRHAAKLEMAFGIIISSLEDAPLRVVFEVEDDPAHMFQLLYARYASSRTVSRVAVQTHLSRMSYKNQNMSSYVDQYSALFAQVKRMGKDATIPESHYAPMLLACINPSGFLESTAAAVRTKDPTILTWEFVTIRLIDEYNAKKMLGSSPALGLHGSGGSSGEKNKSRRIKNVDINTHCIQTRKPPEMMIPR